MQNVLKKVSRGIIIVVLYVIYKCFYGMKIIGRNNIPKEGAIVFCGNHKSYFDGPAITITNGRKTRFIAKEELKNSFFPAFLCWAFESIMVKRDSKDLAPIKEALKTLKSGECLGIFPEGTRNGGIEKEGTELKSGASYFALKTGAQMVPVGIIGDGKAFHRNTVVYGKPMDLSMYQDVKIDKEIEEKVNEDLKKQILSLMKER